MLIGGVVAHEEELPLWAVVLTASSNGTSASARTHSWSCRWGLPWGCRSVGGVTAVPEVLTPRGTGSASRNHSWLEDVPLSRIETIE